MNRRDAGLVVQGRGVHGDRHAESFLDLVDLGGVAFLMALGVEAGARPAIVAGLAERLGRRIEERPANRRRLPLGRRRAVGLRQA